MKFRDLEDHIDGRGLYYMFLAGAGHILNDQAYLNRINVFPVPDGDTGSNLASTVRSVIEKVKKGGEYRDSMTEIADAALDGARGNSGVIFAQFLHGLREETSRMKRINLYNFALGVQRSVRHVYTAISNPVEGTMISVIRDWAEFMYRNRNSKKKFHEVFSDSVHEARRSLRSTRDKLEVLKRANVVDAGGKGFVLFLEGIHHFFRKVDFKNIFRLARTSVLLDEDPEHMDAEMSYRYCTETMIRGRNIDRDHVRMILERSGDSVVIAGSGSRVRIHVHTDDPASLFMELRKFGELTGQKADDMKLQSEVVSRRKADIALVTDSTCDLPEEILKKYQVHVVPILLRMGESEYLDRITIKPEQLYSILDNTDSFPKSSQPPAKSFENLYSFLSSHYSSVISVHISGKLSGTFSVAEKAAWKISSETGKKISVINSRQLSGSLGLVVNRVAEEIESGSTHDDIIDKCGDWIQNAEIFVSVKTLKYMVRGGRVSPMKGLAAKMLNLTPIVSIDNEGKSILIGKSFGQKRNMKKVIDHLRSVSKGKKIKHTIILHAENPSGAEWFYQQVKQMAGTAPLGIVNISPIIGVNAGIGAAALAVMYE